MNGHFVGGVGSGKYQPCRRCRKSVEQPRTYPRAVKQWCSKRCENADVDDCWDEGDEQIARGEEAQRTQSLTFGWKKADSKPTTLNLNSSSEKNND